LFVLKDLEAEAKLLVNKFMFFASIPVLSDKKSVV